HSGQSSDRWRTAMANAVHMLWINLWKSCAKKALPFNRGTCPEREATVSGLARVQWKTSIDLRRQRGKSQKKLIRLISLLFITPVPANVSKTHLGGHVPCGRADNGMNLCHDF